MADIVPKKRILLITIQEHGNIRLCFLKALLCSEPVFWRKYQYQTAPHRALRGHSFP
jgi:hypothetical protein